MKKQAATETTTEETTENYGDVPSWVVMPDGLKVPSGRRLIFIQFLADITETPHKGDRHCIAWTLSDGEERIANARCNGDSSRYATEFTKQMIRAVDGVAVDWSKPKGPGSLDEFWREIGPKGRHLAARIYSRTHLPSDEELDNFLSHCVAVVTAS